MFVDVADFPYHLYCSLTDGGFCNETGLIKLGWSICGVFTMFSVDFLRIIFFYTYVIAGSIWSLQSNKAGGIV